MRLALLVAATLAGCAAPAPSGVVDAPDEEEDHLAVDVSLSACREVGMGRYVSFEEARALLPPGFEPADAGAFLGMPAPAGRPAVLSGHLACAASVHDGTVVAWSDLIVPIEQPQVEGLDLDDGTLDVYQLAHFTSGAETAALFASVGFAASLADIGAEPGTSPSSVARAGTIVDGAELLRFEALGVAEVTFQMSARFWHQTPTGLAYVEHVRTPTPLRFGALLSCEAAEGAVFADAFGATDCTGPDSFAGVFPEPSDFTSTFHHLLGARVASTG